MRNSTDFFMSNVEVLQQQCESERFTKLKEVFQLEEQECLRKYKEFDDLLMGIILRYPYNVPEDRYEIVSAAAKLVGKKARDATTAILIRDRLMMLNEEGWIARRGEHAWKLVPPGTGGLTMKK